jgi:uncharacterized protein YndB with AHSA1/START domain
MEPTIQRGYLVLADLSGYTSYLAGTELIHAQGILKRIIGQIISGLTPVMTLIEVEGDAVFVYASEDRIARGETLLELIESTFVGFRDEQNASMRTMTCACNACQKSPSLDLKFVAHFGEYIVQDIGGKRKLVGSSVNLVHRLLKNAVSDATGWQGYALFTGDCLKQMGIHPEGAYPCVECYEHLGSIETESLNLHERYQQLTEQRHLYLSKETADTTYSYDIPAPVPLLWEWLNDPQKRRQWWDKSGWVADEHPHGRTGEGTISHCSVSKFHEYVRDWRPFSYFTVERRRGPINFTITTELEPTANGTRLHWRFRMNGRLPRWMLRAACRIIIPRALDIENCAQNLQQHLGAEAERYEWHASAVPEPA